MITPCELARLALDLGKATFDNVFTTVTVVQEWVEDGARAASRAIPWVPGQVPALVDEVVGFAGRTRADVRQTVDRCYRLTSDLLGGTDAPVPVDAPSPAAAAPRRARHAS